VQEGQTWSRRVTRFWVRSRLSAEFLRGKTLLRLFSFLDPTRVGASDTSYVQPAIRTLCNVGPWDQMWGGVEAGEAEGETGQCRWGVLYWYRNGQCRMGQNAGIANRNNCQPGRVHWKQNWAGPKRSQCPFVLCSLPLPLHSSSPVVSYLSNSTTWSGLIWGMIAKKQG
jgi:hypothetical protein